MAPKTKEQRLFGAACVKLKLESLGQTDPQQSQLYRDTLHDLALTEAEVEKYLLTNRAQVEAALARGRR